MLHLVQTCSTDVRSQMASRLVVDGDTMLVDVDNPQSIDLPEATEVETTSAFSRASSEWVTPIVESAMKSARTMINFLLSK